MPPMRSPAMLFREYLSGLESGRWYKQLNWVAATIDQWVYEKTDRTGYDQSAESN